MSGTKQFVFVGGYNTATAFLTPTGQLFVFDYFNLLLLCRGAGWGVREAGWKHGRKVTSHKLL